jgi:RHS repeat-associated protein
VWRWDQGEPFGNNPAEENPSGLGAFDLPLRLPGQRYDAETGLHYNYYRDYAPEIGRYIQSDRIGLIGGLNTYIYAYDPTGQIDPLGLMGRPPGKGQYPPRAKGPARSQVTAVPRNYSRAQRLPLALVTNTNTAFSHARLPCNAARLHR